MKLLVAAITFAVTMGVLFIFENRKTVDTAEKNYAQILERLSATGNPTVVPKTVAKKAVSKTQTATPAFTATAISPSPGATASVVSTPRLTPTLVKTTAPVIPTVTPTQTSTPTFTSILPPTNEPSPAPSPQQTSYQIEVVSITSPVKQNSIAEVKIKTAPEAQCGIKVTLPSGSQSTAKGLEPKVADNSGTIVWSWRINWNTKPGSAIIEVSCSKDGRNFSRTFQMEIVE